MAVGLEIKERVFKVTYVKRYESKKCIVDTYFLQTEDKVINKDKKEVTIKYSFQAKRYVELDKNGKAKSKLMEKDNLYLISGNMVLDSYKKDDEYIKTHVINITSIKLPKEVKEDDLPF